MLILLILYSLLSIRVFLFVNTLLYCIIRIINSSIYTFTNSTSLQLSINRCAVAIYFFALALRLHCLLDLALPSNEVYLKMFLSEPGKSEMLPYAVVTYSPFTTSLRETGRTHRGV